MGGAHIGMRPLIEKRGTDITLTPDEQLVYDALIKEKRLPGGSVILERETISTSLNPTTIQEGNPDKPGSLD